jgi:ElaB/YqjD/DUF883 family membrane-anchored ribosome-binding protein
MSEKDMNPTQDDDSETEAPVTARARKLTQETLDAAAEKAEAIERKIRAESGRLGARADDARHDVGEQLDQTLADVEAFIRKEPVKAAGIAFAAGLIAALILRR